MNYKKEITNRPESHVCKTARYSRECEDFIVFIEYSLDRDSKQILSRMGVDVKKYDNFGMYHHPLAKGFGHVPQQYKAKFEHYCHLDPELFTDIFNLILISAIDYWQDRLKWREDQEKRTGVNREDFLQWLETKKAEGNP